MPIFEYVCQDCKTSFEKIILKRDEAVQCPRCGSQKYALQFSVVAAPAKRSDGQTASGCGCTPTSCGCN